MSRRISVRLGPLNLTTRFILALALICRDMETMGIPQALSMLIECLPAEDMAPRGFDEVESYGTMVDIPDLMKRTKVRLA